MGIKESFKRGSMEMLILCLLSKEDMYGYQLAQEINARSNGMLSYINIVVPQTSEKNVPRIRAVIYKGPLGYIFLILFWDIVFLLISSYNQFTKI